jgi:hypothetical protein
VINTSRIDFRRCSPGIAHLFVLGGDALIQAPGWLGGALWTWDHWGPPADQRPGLILSGFAFWSTVGSFAIPLIILGLPSSG